MRTGIRRVVTLALLVCLAGVSLVAASVGAAGAQAKEPLVVPIGMILPSDSPVISFTVNAEALKATNAPEADELIRRPYREGWKLPELSA